MLLSLMLFITSFVSNLLFSHTFHSYLQKCWAANAWSGSFFSNNFHLCWQSFWKSQHEIANATRSSFRWISYRYGLYCNWNITLNPKSNRILLSLFDFYVFRQRNIVFSHNRYSRPMTAPHTAKMSLIMAPKLHCLLLLHLR